MIVKLEEDENGDLILPIPQEFLEGEHPWLTDDVLLFRIEEDAVYITNKTLEERQSNK